MSQPRIDIYSKPRPHEQADEDKLFKRIGFIVMCVMGLIFLLALGQAIDNADRDQEAIDRAQAAQTIAQAHSDQEWARKVARAYEQGQRDAIAANAAKPEGIQLAQTCMAWWYGGTVNQAALKQRVCKGVN